MYLCLNCFEVYSNEYRYDRRDYNFCPKLGCDGEIVEIDELMIPVIKTLNEKGYCTEYCCSGHYGEGYTNTYIKFSEWVELPEELPDGFVYEERGNVIRKNYVDNLHPNEKYIEILNATKDLIEWADNLPDEEY